MHTIIIGAGRIGANLARSLAEENHQVYLIEANEEKAAKLADKLDVKVICGNGADPDYLKRAQVQDADLVVAVTLSDETNLVACSLAELFGAKRRIARVRNESLGRTLEQHGHKQFHINEFINPEEVAGQTIIKTLKAPGSNEVADYANGRLLLRGFDVKAKSPLCGQRLGDLNDEDFPWPFLIIAVIRNQEILIADGETIIQEKDHIHVMLPAQSLGEFLTYVDPDIKMPQKLVVSGATITGIEVAEESAKFIRDVILIEEDEYEAEKVAGEIKNVRVIHGSASEADILTECGIEVADAFVAAAKDDHSNLIAAVLAKKMGAKNTIAIAQRQDFMELGAIMNIDTIINPQKLAVIQLLHLVRGRGVSSVVKFNENDAEVLEFVVGEGAAIIKKQVKDIPFPKDAILGAVHSGDEVNLVKGDTQIKSGDRVVVFCRPKALKKLESLFGSR